MRWPRLALIWVFRGFWWAVINTFFRLRVRGRKNVPYGPAIIASNHLSYADPFLLSAGAPLLPFRFLVWRGIYEVPLFRPFLSFIGSIPISATDTMRKLIDSINRARAALLAGDRIAMFVEGGISRIGVTLAFRKGIEAIAKGTNVPVIPAHIDGMWGSPLSYSSGRFFTKPLRWRPEVTVSFGSPLPAETPAARVREAVLELSVAAIRSRASRLGPLPDEVYVALREHGAPVPQTPDDVRALRAAVLGLEETLGLSHWEIVTVELAPADPLFAPILAWTVMNRATFRTSSPTAGVPGVVVRGPGGGIRFMMARPGEYVNEPHFDGPILRFLTHPSVPGVLASNLPEIRDGSERQTGTRAGTVGRAMPGVAIRVTPEGRLEARAAAGPEGWFDAGTAGFVDEDGFVHVTAPASPA